MPVPSDTFQAEDLPQTARSQDSDVEETPEPIYNSAEEATREKWLNAKFPSEKSLNGHYKSHASQFGNLTKSEYLQIAAELLAQPIKGDIIGYDNNGRRVRYDRKTNTIAIGKIDKNKVERIATVFKPNNGEAYYYEDYKKEHRN